MQPAMGPGQALLAFRDDNGLGSTISPHLHRRPWPRQGQRGFQVGLRQGYAALGGGPVLSGAVEEDGRAQVRDGRGVVPAELDDQVVQPVVAPHPLRARGVGQGHRPVVGGVGGGVAPAVRPLNGLHRQAGHGRRAAVGPPEHSPHGHRRQRRRPVALALGVRRDHPAPSQRALHLASREHEPAVGPGGERGGEQGQARKSPAARRLAKGGGAVQ